MQEIGIYHIVVSHFFKNLLEILEQRDNNIEDAGPHLLSALFGALVAVLFTHLGVNVLYFESKKMLDKKFSEMTPDEKELIKDRLISIGTALHLFGIPVSDAEKCLQVFFMYLFQEPLPEEFHIREGILLLDRINSELVIKESREEFYQVLKKIEDIISKRLNDTDLFLTYN